MVLLAFISFGLVIKVKWNNKTHKTRGKKRSHSSVVSWGSHWISEPERNTVLHKTDIGPKASLGNASVSWAMERTGRLGSFSKPVNRSANAGV